MSCLIYIIAASTTFGAYKMVLCRMFNVVMNVQKIKQYTIQILTKEVKKGATGSEMPGADRQC